MGDWISVPGVLPWWCFGLLLVSVLAQVFRLKALQPQVIVPLLLLLLLCPPLQNSVTNLAAQGGAALLHSPPVALFTHSIADGLPF